VQRCTNYRELVFSKAADQQVAVVGAAYDQLHEGALAVYSAISSAAQLAPIRSRKGNALFMQAYVTLCRGWMGDDPEAIVALWEQEDDLRVVPAERSAIVSVLQAATEMLEHLRPLANEHQVDLTTALRVWGASEAAPTLWPGHYLATQVGAARIRDSRRKPNRSDRPDSDHAMHFPYVDIATCDANTLNVVRRVLPGMTCPRAPIVLNNRQLTTVLEAVRARR
jgi:hypothetical protein